LTTTDLRDTPEVLTAAAALARCTFTEYRKRTPTPISDITFPPGTVYQTPEGLRAEDEETRAAFDVQGCIYPIRESVFRANYEPVPPAIPTTGDTSETTPIFDQGPVSAGSHERCRS